MSDKNYIGNGSTIIKYILVIIAGRTLALAAAHGLNLPVTETQLAEILGVILAFIFSTIDAKYPNNFFNKIIKEIIVPKDDYENIIDDVDPASEYENGGDDDQ